MCNLGSKTQTSTNKVQLPKYLEDSYKGLVQMGQDVASKPLEQYSGPRVAGFSPDQQAAFYATEAAQGMGIPYINAAAGSYDTAGSTYGTAGNTFGSALGTVNDASKWFAPAANTFGTALGGLADAYQSVFPNVEKYDANTLAKYMDPYQQYVIDTTAANVQHQNQVQQQQLRSQGLGAGLSPNLGDRAGLAQAELARGQSANMDQTIAQLLSSGFGNAQQALAGQQQLQLTGMTADQARKLQAAQAAAGIGGQYANMAGLQGQLGATAAGIGGQQANLGTAQANLGTSQANLGQTAQNMTYQGIQQLLANGAAQQGLGQIQLDQNYQQWKEAQDYEKNQTDWLANLIYGSPGGGATTSTATQPGPNLFSQIAGLGTAAAGLFTKSHGGGVVPHFDMGGTPRLDMSSFVYPANTGWLAQSAAPATDPSGYPPPFRMGESTPGATVPNFGSTAAWFNPLPQISRDTWANPYVVKSDPAWVHDVRNFPVPNVKGMNGNYDVKHHNGGGGGGNRTFGFGSDLGGGGGGGKGGGGGGNGGGGGGGSDVWNPAGHAGHGPGSNVFSFARGGVPHFDMGGYTSSFDPGRFDDAGIGDSIVDPLNITPPVSWDTPDPSFAARTDPYPTDTPPDIPASEYGPPTTVPHDSPSVWSRIKGVPLLEMGLGMMASKNPTFLGGVGEGALSGLNAAMSLDAHPEIDSSGPTIRIWYPSEHRWEDTHIPSYHASRLSDYSQVPTPFKDKDGNIYNGQYSSQGGVYFDDPKVMEKYKNGELQPMSPFDIASSKKAGMDVGDAFNIAKKKSAAIALANFRNTVDNVNHMIDQVDRMVDWSTAGFAGGILRKADGTPATDVNNILTSIQANTAFKQLQDMRNSSPTGAAGLGSVSDAEGVALRSVLGSLAASSSPSLLRSNLQQVKHQFQLSLTNLETAFSMTPWDSVPGSPDLDTSPLAPPPADPARVATPPAPPPNDPAGILGGAP